MATKTSNPSDLTRVEEEKKQPQTSRVQDKRTNTTNAHEAQPAQPLCDKEADGISGASSPTGSISQGLDAGKRPPQYVDFIDSLNESETTERLDQLANILDIIDPVVDHGYNEKSKQLDLDAIEPHTEEEEEEDNDEIPSIAQTDHDSNFLKCRGGLADSASQFSGEDCRSDKASQHEGNNGIEYPEAFDSIHFLEHAPERHLSDEAWENEMQEYPWRTWSEDSTLFEASSVHEDRTSLFSLEAQPSDSLSRISIDYDEDEDEDPRQIACEACEAALMTDRSGRHEIPNCESRLDAEDVQPELRALLFEAETLCDERSAAENHEPEPPDYGQAIYGSSSPEPPPPPYDRTHHSTPTTASSAPTPPSPEPTPPQNTLQPPQTQSRTDPPSHNLQTLALVGEASLRSLPTEMLALLGAVEVVGRVVVREVVDFLVRRWEE